MKGKNIRNYKKHLKPLPALNLHPQKMYYWIEIEENCKSYARSRIPRTFADKIARMLGRKAKQNTEKFR